MTGVLASSKVSTVADVSMGHVLFQMVIAIAVIGGGIWLFGKFIQRRRAGIGFGASRQRQNLRGLTVLSRTSLGKEHHLAVVSWGGREVLVGVSGQNITFLTDSALNESADAGNVEPSSVAPRQLRALPEGFGTPSQSPQIRNAAASRPSFLEALRTATLRS